MKINILGISNKMLQAILIILLMYIYMNTNMKQLNIHNLYNLFYL
jgi:hypothetical protein